MEFVVVRGGKKRKEEKMWGKGTKERLVACHVQRWCVCGCGAAAAAGVTKWLACHKRVE